MSDKSLGALVTTVSTWLAENKDGIRRVCASISAYHAWISQAFSNFQKLFTDNSTLFWIIFILFFIVLPLFVLIPQAPIFFLRAIGFAAHGVVKGSLILRELKIFI